MQPLHRPIPQPRLTHIRQQRPRRAILFRHHHHIPPRQPRMHQAMSVQPGQRLRQLPQQGPRLLLRQLSRQIIESHHPIRQQRHTDVRHLTLQIKSIHRQQPRMRRQVLQLLQHPGQIIPVQRPLLQHLHRTAEVPIPQRLIHRPKRPLPKAELQLIAGDLRKGHDGHGGLTSNPAFALRAMSIASSGTPQFLNLQLSLKCP